MAQLLKISININSAPKKISIFSNDNALERYLFSNGNFSPLILNDDEIFFQPNWTTLNGIDDGHACLENFHTIELRVRVQ